MLSCPPHWLALVIKTPTWDPDHLLDSDYHLDQFYPSAHPPHPQKKACWCRSQELRDTNDSWTSDEATQHFWILHTGAEKDLWHAGHCSLERDAYYIVGQQKHHNTLQEDEKRCRFAATTTRFKACPTSALTSPCALYTDTLHTAPAITATISLRPRSNVMHTIAVAQIKGKNTKYKKGN